ncbi:Nodal modulator 1 [Dirofilaria immitis]|nr:Nodal modulator 1 [Dirofilaria immitis]
MTPQLTAKKAEIPDIVAESVEVCVTVNAEENISGVMSIIFTNQQMKAVSTVNGIVMTPKQHEIDLSKGPALDVVFNQFKIDVNVSVVCIDDCGTLKIELWKEKILIKSLEGIDQFIFHQVTPDSYKLKMVDNGRFCWEKTEMDIIVESPDLNYLIFRQVGYRTATRLSHPAKAKWSMLEKPQISDSLDVPAGQFSFCIPLAGIYTVIFEACHKFDKQSYEISIPQEVPLVVSVSKFLLSASIELDQTRNKHDDFFIYSVLIKSDNAFFHQRNIAGINALLDKGTWGNVTFSTAEKLTFTFYLSTLDADALVTLTPQSKTYLFTPTSHIFRFTGECRLDEIIFKADKGIFLEGQVVPAVEGVNIRSSHKSNPNSILESITDVNGKFRMGPVRSVNDFDIIAEKSGYKFERTEELGKLNAIKLSQLIIITTDAETGEPLTNVLISLSGVENYRSNNFIDKTGKITFVGLQPGEYFLRPILQEYRFDPKSVTLNIKEGEFETVNLKGYRFAYSTLGKVSYPAGQPVIGMIVEAVSEQCNQLQEDDTTNETGEYRIRGLHPKCIYRLVLKTPNGQRLQSYPTHYNIMVNTEDIKDIDFVLTHIDERVDVAGNVVFVDINSPPQYKVGLYKSGNLVQQATVIAPSTVFYFEIPTVDNVAYSVRFETTYGVGNQRLDAAEVFFTANETFKAVSLSVLAQRKSEVEISGGMPNIINIFAVLWSLIYSAVDILYIYLCPSPHRALATSFTEEIFVRLSNISSSQHSLSPGDDYADAARKRQNSRKK